jgi:threonine dehydratase
MTETAANDDEPFVVPDLSGSHTAQLANGLKSCHRFLDAWGIGQTPSLVRRFGRRHVLVKEEQRNKTGAYKERGAMIATATASRLGYRKVCVASTGNWARGVGVACQNTGLTGLAFVSSSTPANKVRAIEATGLSIKIAGRCFEDTLKAALTFSANNEDYKFLHPYDDSATIAGQASVGLELIERNSSDYGLLAVPMGGGGLISGIALAHIAMGTNVHLVGVVSEASPAWFLSRGAGKRLTVPTRQSIAQGVSVACPGQRCWPIVERYVETIIHVSDREVDEAIFTLHRDAKIRAEGAGAVAMAACLAGKLDNLPGAQRGQAVVISGGNISEQEFLESCERAGRWRTAISA